MRRTIMLRFAKMLLSCCLVLLIAVPPTKADVKQKTVTTFKMKGAIGSVVGMFGGNKPQQQVMYLKGNLQRTDMLDPKGKVKESHIVDLDQEKFIMVDHKKKRYTEMTFQEWRDMLQSSLSGVFNQKPEQDDSAPETKVEFSFDVDVQKPGEKKMYAGRNTENVILTLKLEGEATQEKEGEDPQEVKGGMIVRSTNWMTKSIDNYAEMKEFAVKLAEKLGMDPRGGFAAAIGQALQQNAELGDAMEKLKEESAKLEGVPMYTHTVFETWGQSSQTNQEGGDQKPEMPSLGGLLKGFGKKKAEEKDPNAPTVLMETFTEIKEFDSSILSDDVFAVPANYKMKQFSRK